MPSCDSLRRTGNSLTSHIPANDFHQSKVSGLQLTSRSDEYNHTHVRQLLKADVWAYVCVYRSNLLPIQLRKQRQSSASGCWRVVTSAALSTKRSYEWMDMCACVRFFFYSTWLFGIFVCGRVFFNFCLAVLHRHFATQFELCAMPRRFEQTECRVNCCGERGM